MSWKEKNKLELCFYISLVLNQGNSPQLLLSAYSVTLGKNLLHHLHASVVYFFCLKKFGVLCGYFLFWKGYPERCIKQRYHYNRNTSQLKKVWIRPSHHTSWNDNSKSLNWFPRSNHQLSPLCSKGFTYSNIYYFD